MFTVPKVIEYCAVHKVTGKTYTGQMEDILLKVCDWWLDDQGNLWAKFEDYDPSMYHSYNTEEFDWSVIYKDVTKFLFNRLKLYNYTIYKRDWTT